ncbi:hypothetical protein GOP47_0005801 [Adiantum capillus-veneris]|uniref:Large ribosomal subunit protein bL12 C-terminal domain-containing protein n=1 Tax=Adiantum capillus-veneris TaxID=13818 RepID=A0A9D4V7E5_ADICA|nr:hypothetical protein GOP47_0005801 [Adiantum capillus-veneris]
MRKGNTLLLHRLRHLFRSCGDGASSCSSTYEIFLGTCTPPVLHRSSLLLRLQHSAATDPDQADGRGPFSEKVLRLRDEIAGLSNEELAAMSAGLRKVLGLPEPPPMGAMPVGGMAADWQEGGGDAAEAPAEEKAPEKTSFSVKLEKFEAASKIKVIKEVRAVTNLGLKEAKEFVEKAPGVVKSGLTKEEAAQLMEKLKAVGATVVME